MGMAHALRRYDKMEKLELLAQRIDGLIQELGRLREENAGLRENIKSLSDEVELGKLEAEELQKKIEIGTSAHNDICTRVDDLIGRIQSVLPEEVLQGGAQEPQASGEFSEQ